VDRDQPPRAPLLKAGITMNLATHRLSLLVSAACILALGAACAPRPPARGRS